LEYCGTKLKVDNVDRVDGVDKEIGVKKMAANSEISLPRRGFCLCPLPSAFFHCPLPTAQCLLTNAF
jgi:hypothetical protein